MERCKLLTRWAFEYFDQTPEPQPKPEPEPEPEPEPGPEPEKKPVMVERVVLPELGRALAFAADCRIEQVISRYEKQAVGLSFSPALTTPAHGVTSLPVKQALDDSLLLVTSTDDGDGAGRLAAWGCGNYRYVGGGRNVAWSGDVFTAHAGADVQLGSTVLAGVSVSRSMGSFDYDAGNISGDYELRMTGVHPYLAWLVGATRFVIFVQNNLYLAVRAFLLRCKGLHEITPLAQLSSGWWRLGLQLGHI